MKVWIYIIGALAIWATAVGILYSTNAGYMSSKIDRVHTYQRTKYVSNYLNTRNTLMGYFTNVVPAYGTPYWDDQTGGGCISQQTFPANATSNCFAKRTTLVLNAKQQMGCDVNKAPICNCYSVILKGVASDNSPNASQGNFTGVGKNLGGLGGYTMYALDNCKWMFRNVFIAQENGNQVVRRTGFLFYLTTLTFFNLIDQTLVPWALHKWTPDYAPYARVLVILLTMVAGLVANLVVESAAVLTIVLVVVVPLILLFWYEMFLPKVPHKKRVWLHPYYYVTTLQCLLVLGMVENGIQDWDALFAEIMKGHATGFAYMFIAWFYTFDRWEPAPNPKYKDIFDAKPVQDALLIATVTAAILAFSPLFAPYNWAPTLNYLYLTPQLFMLFAFGGVTWIHSLKLSDFYGGSRLTEERKDVLEAESNTLSYFPTTKAYFATMHLGITMLVLMYYTVAFDQTNIGIVPNVFNSIQLNASATWLLPP